MHDLQFYLDEFAKDDLIYLFLPIFLLGLAVEVVIDRRKNLQLFEKKDTIAADVGRATSFMDKLKYVFLAPGWNHDGEDKRAKVLRAKLGESDQV